MKSACSILHILPHAGGGVGAVLCALLSAESNRNSPFIHSVATLEQLNNIIRTRLDALKIPWHDYLAMTEKKKTLTALVEATDIVLLHWWNHPLLMQLLFNGLPPARIALWSHVNGFFPPQSFFPELFDLPDRFVFATSASQQAPLVQNLPGVYKQKLRVIKSCIGIPEGAENICVKDELFRMGYVGTVESAKMHPNFLELCSAVKIPSRCIVAGGPAHDELHSRAEYLGIADQFEILGPVDDPTPIFKQLHTFVYPLNPTHYGSGEQVLIEAMAYGAVPVVFDNPPEKSIIRHCETGLIAHTTEEFTNAIRFLADNPADRMNFAEAGRQFVLNECDIKNSVKNFEALYDEMLSSPKRPHRLNLPSYDGITDGSPFHLFLASCGNDAARNYFKTMDFKSILFPLPHDFTSITRGTPQHYLSSLGYDPSLELICQKNYGNGTP